MRVALLDWIPKQGQVWFHRFTKLTGIANSLNIDFEFVHLTDKVQVFDTAPDKTRREEELRKRAKDLDLDFDVVRRNQEMIEQGYDWPKEEVPIVAPEDVQRAGSRTLDLLREADAFVTDGSVFGQFPEALQLLKQRVAGGARVLFDIRNPLNKFVEDFLIPYDMAPLSINICDGNGAAIVQFDRETVNVCAIHDSLPG